MSLRLWSIDNGVEILRLTHKAEVNDVQYTPDGQYLVTASRDASAGVWQIPDRDLLSRFTTLVEYLM